LDGGTCFCLLIVVVAVALGVTYFVRRQGGRTTAGMARPVYQPPPPLATQPPVPGQLPPDIIATMESFGRYSLGALRNPLDMGYIADRIIIPLFTIAQADQNAFLTALRDKTIPVGGWAVYGASRIMREVIAGEVNHPAFDELQAAGLRFLRERGVPNMQLTGYEWNFFLDHRQGAEPWLVGRPKPTPEEAPITELAPDELRRIAQLFPEADSNLVFVRRDPSGAYTAVLDRKWSDDDPTRSQDDWKTASTLNDLYWDIGCNFQVPTHWYHPEMGPYFPLPKPRLD
jgi:hypothetical protein